MSPRNKNRQRRLQHPMMLLALIAGAMPAAAQYANWGLEQQDPLWSEFIPRLQYIKLDLEGERSSYSFNQSSHSSQENQRLYLSTGVGLGWNYFIYHPDLFSFSILAEPGYQLQNVNGTGYSTHQENVLLNGLFTGTILREKPYATTISYSRAHDDYHYDFFDSAVADSETLDVTTGYRDGPVPFTITFEKASTDIAGFNRDTVNDQLTTTLRARNERGKDDYTDLNYQFSQSSYDSTFNSITSSSADTYQRVSLVDHEHFTRSTLYSSLLYYDASSTHSESENLNLSLAYRYKISPSLESFCNYSLSTFSGSGGESIQHFGTVGISHQLYESLGSSINVHGSTLNSSSPGSTFDSTTYGVGGSVDYNKKLGTWGRLSMGNSVTYDLTGQTVTGDTLFVADESYTVPLTGPLIIRLNQPRDISITSVKKNNIELDPSEWSVIQTSDPWQIQFFSGGPNNVQPGDAVMVSYNVTANPSGTYEVFNDNAHISLQFWHERAEIYGTYNLTENYTSSSNILLENVEQLEAGARINWGGFHALARYTDQHSTLYSYQSISFSEGYNRQIAQHSTLGVDFSQQWNIYPPGSGTSTNQTQVSTFYNYTLRYEWRPSGTVNCHAELGYQQQSGLGYDQDRIAARVYLNWQVGKLEFHFGVEHEQDVYSAEKREDDLVFLRMRRNF